MSIESIIAPIGARHEREGVCTRPDCELCIAHHDPDCTNLAVEDWIKEQNND